MSLLDELLKKLISEREGIPPEEITCEYISEQRRKHPLPVDFSSEPQYGGYITEGLTYISDEQFKEEESRFDKFLSQF